jgi:hypothetical protein
MHFSQQNLSPERHKFMVFKMQAYAGWNYMQVHVQKLMAMGI